jgi:hypothetical protein
MSSIWHGGNDAARDHRGRPWFCDVGSHKGWQYQRFLKEVDCAYEGTGVID